jgi:hypothetical protein
MAELLTVMVIFGIISAVVAAVVGPILRAPGQEQLKVDTMQAVAKTVYRIQSDIRQTTASGVYYGTNSVPTTCSAPSAGATPAPAQTLVLTSPRNGPKGPLVLSSAGAALQQGYNVYWLQQNPQHATETDLDFAFVPNPVGWQDTASYISLHIVDPAITASASAQIAATSVTAMNVGLNSSTNDVRFSLTARSNAGQSTNEATFVADTTFRN